MHYYVVGVNGSGKTTLLRAIQNTTGIPAIQGTHELMQYMGIPGDYAALRAMDQELVLTKWGETVTQLIEKHAADSFLLDTHILNLTNGHIMRRDGPWIRSFDALILVTAEPATVLSRIEQDATKDRALFPADLPENEKLELLTQYQNQTEKLFNELSKNYNLPKLTIVNQDIAQAVSEFISFHRRLTQE